MKGLVVKYGEKTYKVGLPDGGVTLSSCIMQNKFTLEAGGSGHAYASVFLKLREDIEFEVEVAEFDKASEPLSETNQPIIDPDYPHEEDPDCVIVKTCSDSLFSIGQKNCQLFVAKLRNFLDSHNRMVLY